MITRRAFFTRLCTGLVGAAVATKVPVTWLPAPVRKTAALEYLRREVNLHYSTLQIAKVAHPEWPHLRPAGIVVSRWLYEQAEGEMLWNERFSMPGAPLHPIYFKGLLMDYRAGNDARVDILNTDEWARYLGMKQTTPKGAIAT